MVELTQHPAQARHPVTNEPLFDDHGAPVPLLPTQRAMLPSMGFVSLLVKASYRKRLKIRQFS
mgnify:CR=1 FL=1